VKKWILLAPVAVIVTASTMAYLRMIPGGLFYSPWDKLAHMALFGWLAAAMAVVLAPRWRAFALWMPLALGIADEFAQSFSTHRSADAMDFAADATGIIVAYAFFRSTSR
jgi:VanZ family protein